MQVGTDIGPDNQIGRVGMVRVAQVVGDALSPAGETESAVETGFADVEAQQDDFLAQQGQTDGGVGS